ncbi:unnamed protein product [Symbiodinium sp. CCMP2592]|nr:unnamed protein product [Symbiodinium sp. CCMP2592]
MARMPIAGYVSMKDGGAVLHLSPVRLAESSREDPSPPTSSPWDSNSRQDDVILSAVNDQRVAEIGRKTLLPGSCVLRVLAQEKRQWSKDAPDNSPALAIADAVPNDDTKHVEPSGNGDPSENNNQEPNNDDAEDKDDQAPDDSEESSSSSSSSSDSSATKRRIVKSTNTVSWGGDWHDAWESMRYILRNAGNNPKKQRICYNLMHRIKIDKGKCEQA